MSKMKSGKGLVNSINPGSLPNGMLFSPETLRHLCAGAKASLQCARIKIFCQINLRCGYLQLGLWS